MIRISLSSPLQQVRLEHSDGPIEFGRGRERGARRCVVQDPYVSADQLAVEEVGENRVRLANLSRRIVIRLREGSDLAIGEVREVGLPIELAIGKTRIEILPGAGGSSFEHVAGTVEIPTLSGSTSARSFKLEELGERPNPETLTHWFETMVSVLTSAAGSMEYFGDVAKALVETIGLEEGEVLLRRGGEWVSVASRPKPNAGNFANGGISPELLHEVLEKGQTICRVPNAATGRTPAQESALVISPVKSGDEHVIGCLFGRRRSPGPSGPPRISPLDAQVVQLLASIVGVGLTRQEKEAEAARSRVQFEQFFSPVLARELARNPDLLSGQEREVTILFTDLRGFSKLSEKLSPSQTCRIVSDVMDALTRIVVEFDGVVVDYQGDGLMAMWNAPVEVPDNAARACRAGLLMIEAMPEIGAPWRELIGADLRVGVGVNSGTALVGNIGSRRKFKYGPMGACVNVASRVEGATKYLGVPLLLTGRTRELLPDSFAVRRIVRARLVGMLEPVDLFEMHADEPRPEWSRRAARYESGLSKFEAGQFQAAFDELHPLLSGDGATRDHPSLKLAERAMRYLDAAPERFDPVLSLDHK